MLSKKIKLDLAVFLISAAIIVIIFLEIPYSEPGWIVLSLGMMLVEVISFIVMVRDIMHEQTAENDDEVTDSSEAGITRVNLLDEEEGVVRSWDIFGRISLLIGRDIGENQVDIDLSDTKFSSMIEVEHAVLNYADGCWYVEDVGSKNGLSVKKYADGNVYKLAADVPCCCESGDIIILGFTRLQLM